MACIALLITTYWMQSSRKDPLQHLWFERPQAHLATQLKPAENNIAKHLRETVRIDIATKLPS